MKADFPTPRAFESAAWLLRCDVPAIRAFAEVEAGREGAYYDDGQPVILFERHHFHKHTHGKFTGARVPGVSHEWARICEPTPGGYGPSSQQHTRLQAAAALNREAALRSASWGLFQLMGSNHAACGYPNLQRFITAMYREVDDHLRAFVMFIRHNELLTDALRNHDWDTAARLYNGPLYYKNKYDTKLELAHARWIKELAA
jgi:hypothetical protein